MCQSALDSSWSFKSYGCEGGGGVVIGHPEYINCLTDSLKTQMKKFHYCNG